MRSEIEFILRWGDKTVDTWTGTLEEFTTAVSHEPEGHSFTITKRMANGLLKRTAYIGSAYHAQVTRIFEEDA